MTYYVAMLRNFCEPELRRRGIDPSSVRFQQGGATAHTARATMSVLWEIFPQHVISRVGDVPLPARSPDLSVCDYFLWGYLKSRVFISKPRTTAELKQSMKGRNRGDLGADDSAGDGKSWSKIEAVFEKLWKTSE